MDWWTATSTVATAGATLVALYVTVSEGVQRNADLRERDEERRDQEAMQARALTVTVQFNSDGDLPIALITNHSTLPILDVDVE